MADIENIILRRMVDKSVDKVLGNLVHEFSDLVKTMNPEDCKKSSLLLLDMMESSCKSFFAKMRERVMKHGLVRGGGGH